MPSSNPLFDAFKALDEGDSAAAKAALMSLAQRNTDLRVTVELVRQALERITEIEIGTEVARIAQLALDWIGAD